jgi:TatD DNase family protein
LHPQLAAERGGELPLWERYLSEARYVGEVGLDAGSRFHASLGVQKRVFRTVLERCADAGDKILTVHSVRSVPAVLDMVEAYLPIDRGTVVMHWFTGNRSDARRAAALGCYFSINAAMTQSDRGRTLIANLPLARLLTETDGPFTHIGERASEPADVKATVDAVARIRCTSPEAIANAVRTNLQVLLQTNTSSAPRSV